LTGPCRNSGHPRIRVPEADLDRQVLAIKQRFLTLEF
jgi:hypothetical protein